MDDRMSGHDRANELFADILARHSLTIDAAATITGYSTSHVGRWKLGESVIPIDAWGSIYNATKDIALFLALGIPLARISDPPNRAERTPEDPQDLIPELITAQENAAICLRYMHKITRDGHVDAKDDVAIGQFSKHKREVCGLYDRVERGLIAKREEAEEK